MIILTNIDLFQKLKNIFLLSCPEYINKRKIDKKIQNINKKSIFYSNK